MPVLDTRSTREAIRDTASPKASPSRPACVVVGSATSERMTPIATASSTCPRRLETRDAASRSQMTGLANWCSSKSHVLGAPRARAHWARPLDRARGHREVGHDFVEVDFQGISARFLQQVRVFQPGFRRRAVQRRNHWHTWTAALTRLTYSRCSSGVKGYSVDGRKAARRSMTSGSSLPMP